MRHTKPLALTLLLGLLLLSGTAAAEEPVVQEWKDGPVSPASPRDFIPSPSSAEAYIERYTSSVDLDGGGWIGAYLTISNLGVGDNHASVRVRIQLPGRDKEFEYTKKVDAADWSSAKGELDLKIAGFQLKGQDNKHFSMALDDSASGVKMELAFTNNLPMWKPGNGRIDVSNGYLAYGMLAPRASVKGRVFIDGEWREVVSTRGAFADHASTDVAPYAFANRFSRFRTFNGKLTLAWREIKLAPEYGGRSMTWILVGYKDKIVFSDAGAVLKTGRVSTDSVTGYKIPYAVQIDGKSGKDSVKIVMRASKMKRTDLLESYGTVARMVAGAVSKPFRYEFPSEYTIQMNIGGATATLKGTGSYSFDIMNP